MKMIRFSLLLILLVPSLISAQSRYREAHRSILHKMDMMRALQASPGKGPAAPDPTDNQDYFDIYHYSIDIAFNDSTSYVAGTVTASLVSLMPGLSSLDMNADPVLTIDGVHAAGQGTLSYSRSGDVVSIDLASPLSEGDSLDIVIDYGGYPGGADNVGLHFDSYNGSSLIWSLSEPWSARSWWPCKDYPE
ncbi:MAG: hypothetical protein GF417_03755, partial [Candidatus Latescibacteria bacterium]|nr:hypothetical protein [Candidatus Latescibacterota bacterium]